MTKPDLIIIGGGPAGYTAAKVAAKNNYQVHLYDSDNVGGTCLNHGCIPTKTLLESSSLYTKAKKANYFGVKLQDLNYNFQRIIQRKNIVVSKLVKSLHQDLCNLGIQVIPEHITIEQAAKQSPKVLIATGTSPKTLQNTISTNETLNLEELPANLHIHGAGVIGLEFATFFNQLGCKVSVSDIANQILPNTIDKALANKLQKILEKQGIKITLNQQLSAIPYPLSTTQQISCIGRQFNNQGFREAGLELGPKGELTVNQYLKTNKPDIYAAGDIIGQEQLAHVAYEHGKVAAFNITGKPTLLTKKPVPSCIFTNPGLATVGVVSGQHIIEKQFANLGIAQAKADTEGLIRFILSDIDQRTITGIQIISSAAAELITTASLIVQNKMTLDNLSETIWAHPTLGEIFKPVQ